MLYTATAIRRRRFAGRCLAGGEDPEAARPPQPADAALGPGTPGLDARQPTPAGGRSCRRATAAHGPASVGLPDGSDFEQYVMRMRRTATTVVVDDHLMARMGHDSERAAIIYQHEAQGADLVITSAIDAHIEALKATQSERRD